MSKKILGTYLKSLSEDEKKSFLDYLNSPIFPIVNRSRSIKTYEYLLKNFAPSFASKEMDIERIQKDIGFTNVKNVFTSLIQSIEDFLSLTKYQEQRNDRAIYLLQVLKEKDLNNIFSKRVDQYLADEWKDIGYAQDKFFHLYRVYRELNTSYSIDSLNTSDDSLFNSHKYHDLHYTLIKLKALISIHAQKNSINKQIDINEYHELVEKVESSENSNFILQLYILLFKYVKETRKENLKENFFECKRLYYENIHQIPRHDKHVIFVGLCNYCYKINKLEANGFLSELFALYRLADEHKTLFFNDIIHPGLFFNIVQVSSDCDELEWAEGFLSKTKKKLAGKFQEPITLLSRAYILSSSSRCSDALELLAQVELKDLFIALRSKIITIKCYYELEEMYALDNYLKTFQNYIRRQKQMSDIAKKRYLKFSSVVGKLMKVDSSKERKDIESFIKQDDNLIFKSWLARMANQL